MAQQPHVVVSSPPFTFWPIRWLIVVLVVLLCILGLLGVVPGDAKTFFGLILALAIAVFF